MKTALLITESSVYTNSKGGLVAKGGGEMGMHILAKQLLKIGVKPFVFAIREYSEQKPEETIDGVVYQRFNVKSRTSFALISYLRVALKESLKVDFVFLNQFVPHLLLPYLKCIKKIAIVHDVYGNLCFWLKQYGFFKGIFGYFVEKVQLRYDRKYTDSIMAVSDYGKMQIEKFLGKEVLNKTVVNFWPIEQIKLANSANMLQQKENFALFVGRFIDYKNPTYALFALAKIRSVYPNFRLKVVVSRVDEIVWKKFVNLKLALGFTDYDVEIIFDCAHEHLNSLYARAKLFLHPSLVEGLGLACAEALSFSTPVVAYDLAAYKSFLIHGKNAQLAYFGDVDAFCSGALAILDDYESYFAQCCLPQNFSERNFQKVLCEMLFD